MSNEQYLVTARKYRPQRFADLVSQHHVSETLRNALKLDRLAHAYLFSGPRGVGKTTVARILAQAINCTTPLDERSEIEPCGTCDSCRSFQEGRSMNIIEIDAASNNSVEDVRALREKVRIPPQGAKKKVYIVDEVHMLSNSAFNALLKTLEEPPPHVLFIFATTEPHKVLPTILSRCQRFDFHRISTEETVRRLEEICANEQIEADAESLMLIARKGDGALRDALSVLDQSIALCGTTLHYQDLAEALGVVDVDLYFDVIRFIREDDSAGMLELCDNLVRSGYDFIEFIAGLTEHIRNLLVVVSTGSDRLIEATDAVRARYAEEAEGLDESDLLHMLMILDQTEASLKYAAQPRLKLEMALLKLTRLPRAVDFKALMKRLEGLEKGNGEGSRGVPQATAERGSESQPREGNRPAARAETATASAVRQQPQPASPEPRTERAPSNSGGRTPASPPAPVPAAPAQAAQARTPVTAAEPRSSATARSFGAFAEPALKHRPNTAPSAGGTSAHASIESDVAVEEVDEEAERKLKDAQAQWTTCVKTAIEDRIHVGALLQHGYPVAVQNGILDIGVPDDFHVRMLENQNEFISGIIKRCTDVAADGIRFVVSKNVVREGEETAEEVDPLEQMKKLRQENPLVKAIFEQFGGEMVW